MDTDGGEQIKKLAALHRSLISRLKDSVLQAAFDLNAAIADRVQNDGLSDTGAPFGTYAISTQRAKTRKRHDRTPFPLINFTDTGQMFNSVMPDIKQEGDTLVITLAAHGQDNVDKMGYMVDKFGSIIKPNKQELQDAVNDILKRMHKIINTSL